MRGGGGRNLGGKERASKKDKIVDTMRCRTEVVIS